MAPYLCPLHPLPAAAGLCRRIRQLHQMGHHRRSQMASASRITPSCSIASYSSSRCRIHAIFRRPGGDSRSSRWAFVLALLMNQKLRGRNIARAIVFLPHVVSVAAVGIIFQWILERSSGLAELLSGRVGRESADQLAGRPRFGYAGHRHHHYLVDGQRQYDHLPGGLAGYPGGLVRSRQRSTARAAGKKLRYVTIPMLMPVNAFVIPLTVIACWRVFGQVFVMTRGGPQGSNIHRRPIHL